MIENEASIPIKSRQELMALLETEPELSLFYTELQDILVTDPNLVLTIRHIAKRIVPESLQERVEAREARVSVNVTKLVSLGLLQARRYKTEDLGDYLPTYVAIGL